MWSVPAKNMKKINMSISFVYDVSIQDNCENAVFTFLPFYKQNITFSTIKEYSMGTTQPIRNNDELTAFRMYYKDIRPNSRNYCLIVMGLNTALRISNLLRLKWDNVYNYTCRYQPISRTQAYRIVKTAAGKTVQDEHISCHSLRKTFGYHAWKNGTPPALLMDVYNHSSYEITQHYLGIEQDERDEIYLKLEL